MNAAVAATFAGYLAASGLFLGYLYGLKDALARAARWALLAAVAAHLVAIGLSCATTGISPVRNLREALSFFAWLTALGYLLVGTRYRIAVGGAFVAPIVLGLYALARLAPLGAPGEVPLGGMLGKLLPVHIALSTLGVAAFGLSASVAGLYLLQERHLKQKKGGAALYKRIPPLGTLDAITYRVLTVGFPIYTAAVITGFVASRAGGQGTFMTPGHAMALGIWLIYAILIGLRTAAGWGGRRGAVGTIIGFVGALGVIATYALRG